MTIESEIRARYTKQGSTFLRGSIPVPKGWVPEPLVVEDSNGIQWPTQYKIASKGMSNGARHIDLRALVMSPGGDQKYKVISGVGERKPTQSGASFPGLRISAADHTNKVYTSVISPDSHVDLDLFKETRKSGELLGPDRFFGYTAYLTTIAGVPDVVIVDMKIKNGNVQDEILHHLFFKSIELDIPAGWEIMHKISEPFVNGKTLMAPNANGKMHVLLQGAEKEYRFAIYKPGAAQNARNLLDCTGFYVCEHSLTKWSWHNPKTAHYLPQNCVVPSLSLTYDAYGANGTQINAALATGNRLDVAELYGSKGPYYPRGNAYGGVTGGNGITGFPALETLSSGRLVELDALFAVHKMDLDRSAGMSLVDSNQNPINPMNWKDKIGSIEWIQFGKLLNNNEGPWQRSKANQSRYTAVSNAGLLPDYYTDLVNYEAYDYQHLIRGLGPVMALAWLISDPLAKETVATYAAWSRLLMLEFGKGSLYSALSTAKTHPGKGGLGGREHGWATLAIAANYQLANDIDRESTKSWFEAMFTMMELAQLPSGGWLAGSGKMADTVYAIIGSGPKIRASQAIEIGIFANGLRAMQVCTEDSRITTMIAKLANGCRNFHWKTGSNAPHTTIAVRYEDITQPAFTEKLPNGFTTDVDNYQVYVIPLYALLQDKSNQDALTMINWLTGDDAINKLTKQMPHQMNEGAGILLGYLQTESNIPPVIINPPPPPTEPPPPVNPNDPFGSAEKYVRRLRTSQNQAAKDAAVVRIKAMLQMLT